MKRHPASPLIGCLLAPHGEAACRSTSDDRFIKQRHAARDVELWNNELKDVDGYSSTVGCLRTGSPPLIRHLIHPPSRGSESRMGSAELHPPLRQLMELQRRVTEEAAAASRLMEAHKSIRSI
ncbi:hypothetical protein EYF80_050265 [Liparis tanakae]|uniref:Uncharacterized protein n=1 Tax=Liparis tanakae TaxID=230148 RepID=A0A4Z2FFP7_9TELE|nr:hypothetical protein EYF80_050265 [Liparis tanakae]